MSNQMTKTEIMQAVKLREDGIPIERISAAIKRGECAISKHIKNWYKYGDSYFTDYPTPLNRK